MIEELEQEIIRLENDVFLRKQNFQKMIDEQSDTFLKDCIRSRMNAELAGINKKINKLFQERKKIKYQTNMAEASRLKSIRHSKEEKWQKLISKFETFNCFMNFLKNYGNQYCREHYGMSGHFEWKAKEETK